MFTTLPQELRLQIWSWVCHSSTISVQYKPEHLDVRLNSADFHLVSSRDILLVRLFAGSHASRLIHANALLDFTALRSIRTLDLAIHSLADALRPFARCRIGYYGLFSILRSVPTSVPFDCIRELELQCCTRSWPPVEPMVALCDDDIVKHHGSTFDGTDGPLLLVVRYCMTRLNMADDAVVRLVRCFVGRGGCEMPTEQIFLVRMNRRAGT